MTRFPASWKEERRSETGQSEQSGSRGARRVGNDNLAASERSRIERERPGPQQGNRRRHGNQIDEREFAIERIHAR